MGLQRTLAASGTDLSEETVVDETRSGQSAWRLCRRSFAKVAALALLAGCSNPLPAAEARLAEVKLHGREMDVALDLLEERLLGSQANVELWQEMAQRHQNVSALACENTDAHLQGMFKNLERQDEKARLKRRQVASANPAVGRASSAWSKRRN